MLQTSLRLTVFTAAAMALLAGCASAPADTTLAAAQPAAPVAKCHHAEAATGSSIVRKDCTTTNNVSEVDPRDLMESKRVALPNR